MTDNYLNRMTAIEYRRTGRAEDTGAPMGLLNLLSIFGKQGELLCVGEVAQASNLTLVLDEVGFGDERD